jgi:branched-chain amino acid transport system ATP-binding protein
MASSVFETQQGAGLMLAVRDITKRFGALVAVNDVTFTVQPGELVALIGPNGAGKSTLLDMLAGEQIPTAGEIEFNGERITASPAHAVTNRGIARTFQQLHLFGSMSVRDNVIAGGARSAGAGLLEALFGLPAAGRRLSELQRRADEALDTVGLRHRAEVPANALPAGERRLVSIARALATGQKWLLLDEPGAGLNAVEKDRLLDVIHKLSLDGKTIIFVEHDMSLVGRLARRVLVLDQGRLIADGTPEQVRAEPAVIEAYLGVHRSSRQQPVATAAPSEPLLNVVDVSVSYGGLRALNDASLTVGQGEMVAVVGPNGAGKSTLLKAIAGVVGIQRGSITLADQSLTGLSSTAIVRAGISLAPEGREIFGSLSVEDNLSLGRYTRGRGIERLGYHKSSAVLGVMDEVFALFPRLRERRHQLAETLSGGEGQMLAIGRALMSSPRLLMLDEPSLGLAPRVIDEIFERLVELRARGLSILLIEQNARAALEIADRGYIVELSNIVTHGPARELLANTDIVSAYLGNSETGRLRAATPEPMASTQVH